MLFFCVCLIEINRGKLCQLPPYHHFAIVGYIQIKTVYILKQCNIGDFMIRTMHIIQHKTMFTTNEIIHHQQIIQTTND